MKIRKSNLSENNKNKDDSEVKRLQESEVELEKNNGNLSDNNLTDNKERSSIRKVPNVALKETPSNEVATKTKFERISDASLSELVNLAEDLHVLPREAQMKINKTHRNWLISQIRKQKTEDDLIDFAYRLDHKELSLIFPILATTHRKSIVDKLNKIISIRASKVLYIHGWTTLQYIYPENRFARNFSDLCRELENLNFPSDSLLNDPKNKNQLSYKVLPYPHFDWTNIKLITEIAVPDNRRFMNNIMNHIFDNQITLEDFFYEYGIYDDLSLGMAIRQNYDVKKLERRIHSEGLAKKSWRDIFKLGQDDLEI
ncbi:MAG: hypothetical protein GX326_04830 [Clostridiaceae bacterium]|mgnify:FL=1|nr:hypothetical protein [Clostridiaceae bacterium]